MAFRFKAPRSWPLRLILIAIVFLAGTAAFGVRGFLGAEKNAKPPASGPDKNLPHYHEIMEVIRPLNYSGFYAIQKPGITLSIDFKRRTWTVHNIRRYAPDGTLLLDEGRNGLCAELAYYTFQKIKPLLSKPWQIKFARTTESGFFFDVESNHVVLVLGDPETQAAYLLDPSFHQYGTTAEFSQYTILAAKDDLPSFEQKDPDTTLAVDHSFPLLIRNNSLVLLSVESISGFVDPKNIMLAISSRRRYEASDHYLMVLRREGGQTKWFENEDDAKGLLTEKEIDEIRKRFIAWMDIL